ncbi:membrane protein [Hymenobacter frigidus]|uniref:Membrane protein n=1 Tax=Hymenobacter frigidus TaxID=1524095 RepID=A0ABQ2AH94_9BACT|nr:RagB/SusD family nutrient uptake outer membrane protein [Hymenobacter frigidus]GGH90101.1 membrane protein [Hymenobacter frigidus]
MKKSFLSVLGLSLLLAATGCDKDILDEDPRSILVPSFLGTAQGIQAGLAGVYSGLRNTYGGEEGLFFGVTGTDEFMRGIQSLSGLDEYNPAILTPAASSAATNQWSNWYRYINNANGVLKYSATVQGLTPAQVKQIVAEAKLLRAHYYFLLMQYYGDVPLMLEFIEAPTKDIARAPVAAVYASIIADLNDAVANIADRAAQPGRVTKALALHMLAKAHLTRATSTARQADDYAKAAQFAKQLIDNRATYGIDLEADVADVHREGNENGKEVLFNIQFNADATFTQQEPFQFQGANQSSFFFRSRYDLLPNMTRDIPNGRPFARFVPTPYLVDSYILSGETGAQLRTTDTRYNKWFKTVWSVNSPGSNGGRATAVRGDTAAWYPGRELPAATLTRIANRTPAPYRVIQPSQYTTEYFPVLNKYDAVNRTGVNNPSTRPFIVYRFAETYLIAAEAFMYMGNLPQAVAYINTVRERAGAVGRKNLMTITASQLNIDFILDERSRELAGEYMRWHDLVRTGKLVERVRAKVPLVVNRPNGTYGSAAAANIRDFHVLRPIPQQEIDRTGGKITQNPGYN